MYLYELFSIWYGYMFNSSQSHFNLISKNKVTLKKVIINGAFVVTASFYSLRRYVGGAGTGGGYVGGVYVIGTIGDGHIGTGGGTGGIYVMGTVGDGYEGGTGGV